MSCMLQNNAGLVENKKQICTCRDGCIHVESLRRDTALFLSLNRAPNVFGFILGIKMHYPHSSSLFCLHLKKYDILSSVHILSCIQFSNQESIICNICLVKYIVVTWEDTCHIFYFFIRCDPASRMSCIFDMIY